MFSEGPLSLRRTPAALAKRLRSVAAGEARDPEYAMGSVQPRSKALSFGSWYTGLQDTVNLFEFPLRRVTRLKKAGYLQELDTGEWYR